MPEIKKHFAGGKMNKDLDERLVPNGEYRDAMNIEVSTSESSNVGSIQNILGNTDGCNWSTNPILSGSKTVGTISDEKNDTLYWLVCGPSFDTAFILSFIADLQATHGNSYNPTTHFTPIYAKDMILRHHVSADISSQTCEPVFVDKYGLAVANVDTNSGASDVLIIDANHINNVHAGMSVQTISPGGVFSNPVVIESIGGINNITSNISLNYTTSTVTTQSFNGTNFQVIAEAIPANTGSNQTNNDVYTNCILIPDCFVGSGLGYPLNTGNAQQALSAGCDTPGIWQTQIASQGFILNASTVWSIMDVSGTNMLSPYATMMSQELVLMSFASGQAFRKVCFGVGGVPTPFTPSSMNLLPTATAGGGGYPDYHTLYNPSGSLGFADGGFLNTNLATGPFSFLATQQTQNTTLNNQVSFPSISPWLDDIYQILFSPGSDNMYGGFPNDDVPSGVTLQVVPSTTYPDLGNGNGGCLDLAASYNPNNVALTASSPSTNTFHIVDCVTGAPVNPSISGFFSRAETITFQLPPNTYTSNTLILNAPLPNVNMFANPYLYFYSDRVLKFSGKTITGLNIIDDMLFWTDGETEPKKINIPRSVQGTVPTGLEHTKLINLPLGIHPVTGSTVPVREDHVTVIRKQPKNPLVLESIKDRKHDKFYSAVIDTLPPVGSISTPNTSSFITLQRHFNAIEVGDELALWLPQALDSNGILVQDFTLNWKVGTKLLLQPADSTGSLPSTPITIESSTITAEVVSWDNGGVTPSGSWNHFTSDSTATGYPGLTNINNVNLFTPLVTVQQPVLDSVARVRIRINEIKSAPPVAGAGYPDPLQWVIDELIESEKLYEFKFPRFAYRYKYTDGEYSTISHFTEVGFEPGPFEYHSKFGHNLAMRNRVIGLKLSGFTPLISGPVQSREFEDVESIDILHKEEGSPSIYVVDTIRPDDELLVNEPFNSWTKNEYTITSENINAILPENQLLRGFDNVPLTAKAQEVTGNRLVYGNYSQQFDLTTQTGSKYYPDFTINIGAYLSGPDTVGHGIKSIKSLRDYQLGVTFLDEFGRETPVISSVNATFTLGKEKAPSNNRLTVGLSGSSAPSNMKFFKFYIKETSGEYYNLAMDRWYDAEDGGIWLSFPSSDRNKVDIDDYIVLKKGMETDEAVKEAARYKILAIENEAPDFIKTKKTLVSAKTHHSTSTQAVYHDIFTHSNQPLLNKEEFKIRWDGVYDDSSVANIDEKYRVGDSGSSSLYFQLEDKTRSLLGERYRIASINKTRWDGGTAPSEVYFNIKLTEKLGTDINVFTNDPSGQSQINILDKVQVNIWEYTVENSPEFDGRFFIKIHRDAIFQKHIVSNQPITQDQFSVSSYRQFFRLQEQGVNNGGIGGSDQHRYSFRNYDVSNVNGTDYHLSSFGFPEWAATTTNNSSACRNWKDYIDVTNMIGDKSGGVQSFQGFTGAGWIPYQSFFRGLNIFQARESGNPQAGGSYWGAHGIKWRVPGADQYSYAGHWEFLTYTLGYPWSYPPSPSPTPIPGNQAWYDSTFNPAFIDIWFIDEDTATGSFSYDSGDGVWKAGVLGSGNSCSDTNTTGLGYQAPGGNSTLEIGFGGIQPIKPWKYSSCNQNSPAEADEFFKIADANTVYAGEQQDFVNKIKAGQRFRFREDPSQEIYTINDVTHKYKVRFDDDVCKQNADQKKSAMGLPSGLYNTITTTHNSICGGGGDGSGAIYATSTYYRPENFTRNWVLKLDKPLTWNPVGPWKSPISGGTTITRTINQVSGQGSEMYLDYTHGTHDRIKIGMVLHTVNGNTPLDDYSVAQHLIVTSSSLDNADPTQATYEYVSMAPYDASIHAEGNMTGTTATASVGQTAIFKQYTMNGLSPNSAKNISFFSGYMQAGNPYATGWDVIGVDSLGYTIEFLDGLEGGEAVLSSNPAIWETEPKDTTDLDIYYEISGYNPLILDGETIRTFIPIGSTVLSLFTTGENPPLGTSVIGYDQFGNISLSHQICYDDGIITGPCAGHPLNPADPLLLNSPLSIQRPDGTIVRVIVTAFLNDPTGSGLSNTLTLNNYLYNTRYSLNYHNCYSFGNGVESNRIRDTYNLPYILNGVKASTTLSEQYKREIRKYGLIYSGLYNSTSGINNLNQFIMAEKITKDINPIYGSIQKLHSRDTDLITLCEDKILKILANKDAVYNADGDPRLVATENVLGQTIPFIGEYGISKNPESFASESYRAYFTDKARGAVMRLSKDGLTPISEHGMKDWFRDNLKLTTDLIGSYDDRKDEYNITLIDKTAVNPSHTVSFKENVKGWVSFKSFIPELANSSANEYFTFSDANLYKHHVTTDSFGNTVERNTFKGQYTNSSFTAILNDEPSSVKSFKTLNYEGTQSRVKLLIDQDPTDPITGFNTGTLFSDNQYYNLAAKEGWHVESIITDKEKGNLEEFIEKEGKWFNYIRGKTIGVDINGSLTNDYSDFDVESLAVQGLGKASGSATVIITPQCTEPGNFNTVPGATHDCNSDPAGTFNAGWNAVPCCIPIIPGCMDPNADLNSYIVPTGDPAIDVNTSDGSCRYLGCLSDTTALNYGGPGNNNNIFPFYTDDDNSCITVVTGCTNPVMFNYNSTANVDDGSCVPVIMGCTDNITPANNYVATSNALIQANTDDGSCEYWGCLNDSQSIDYINTYPLSTTIGTGINAGQTATCDDTLPYPNPGVNILPPCITHHTACSGQGGCIDPTACQGVYPSGALIDNQSCYYTACALVDNNVINYGEFEDYNNTVSNLGASIVGHGAPPISSTSSCGCEICESPENLTITDTYNGNGTWNINISFTVPSAPWNVGQLIAFLFYYRDLSATATNQTASTPFTWTFARQNATSILPGTVTNGDTVTQTFIFAPTNNVNGQNNIHIAVETICTGFNSNGTAPHSPRSLTLTHPTEVHHSLSTIPVSGCTCSGPGTTNFNGVSPDCTSDLGYAFTSNVQALNFDPTATIDDGSCIEPIPGCTCGGGDPANYPSIQPAVGQLNGLLTPAYNDCYGNGYPASNFNPNANVDDGSCSSAPLGCTDPTALNYCSGCIDPNNTETCHTSCDPITNLTVTDVSATQAKIVWSPSNQQPWGVYPNNFISTPTQKITVTLERWDATSNQYVDIITNNSGYPSAGVPSNQISANNSPVFATVGMSNVYDGLPGTDLGGDDGSISELYIKPCPKVSQPFFGNIWLNTCHTAPTSTHPGNDCGCFDYNSGIGTSGLATAGSVVNPEGNSLFPGILQPNTTYKISYQVHCTASDSSIINSRTFTTLHIDGCTNPIAMNYNPWVTNDDGSCQINGCMDPAALNNGCSIDHPQWNSSGTTTCNHGVNASVNNCSNNACCNYPQVTIGCMHAAAFNDDCSIANNPGAIAPCGEGIMSTVTNSTSSCRTLGLDIAVDTHAGTSIIHGSNFSNINNGYEMGYKVALFNIDLNTATAGKIYCNNNTTNTNGCEDIDPNYKQTLMAYPDYGSNSFLVPTVGDIEGGWRIPSAIGMLTPYIYNASWWPSNQRHRVTDFTWTNNGTTFSTTAGNKFLAIEYGAHGSGRPQPSNDVQFEFKKKSKSYDGTAMASKTNEFGTTLSVPKCLNSPITVVNGSAFSGASSAHVFGSGGSVVQVSGGYSGNQNDNKIYFQYSNPGLNPTTSIMAGYTDPAVGGGKLQVCVEATNGNVFCYVYPAAPNNATNTAELDLDSAFLGASNQTTFKIWYGMFCDVGLTAGNHRVFNKDNSQSATTFNDFEDDYWWWADSSNIGTLTASSKKTDGAVNGNAMITYDKTTGTWV